jgi:hypothetical protein
VGKSVRKELTLAIGKERFWHQSREVLRSRSVFNLSKEFVHEFLLVVKAGLFDTVERVSEIDQPMFGGHGENAECPRNPKSLASGYTDTLAIIHQNQIGV